ncbi:uncharacterized protein KGF55_000375 [Candida pseudojiufengensis]|uniref:uncharacterized protein n=1 Tax=Candida pseudojiufengensis TaxID=497109 RepID=UPI0022259AFA|nr:uncharacterized protein KGF55_000375 [Candida pseudojiufengensis]KAI5966966.1 hypothetical protein KGF55_000375 [Candida pseudojiufengensis]
MNQDENDPNESYNPTITNKRSNFQFTYDSENFLLSLIDKYKQDIFTRGSRIRTWEKVLNEFNSKYNSNIIQSRTINHRFQTLKSNLKNKLMHERQSISEINLNENEKLIMNILQFMYQNNFCSTDPYRLNSEIFSASNEVDTRESFSSADTQIDYANEHVTSGATSIPHLDNLTRNQTSQYSMHEMETNTKAELHQNMFSQHHLQQTPHQHTRPLDSQLHQHQHFSENLHLPNQQLPHFNPSTNIPIEQGNFQDVYKHSLPSSSTSVFNHNQQELHKTIEQASHTSFDPQHNFSSSLTSNPFSHYQQHNHLTEPTLEPQIQKPSSNVTTEDQHRPSLDTSYSNLQKSQSIDQENEALHLILKQLITQQSQNNLQIINLHQDLQNLKTETLNHFKHLTDLIEKQNTLILNQQQHQHQHQHQYQQEHQNQRLQSSPNEVGDISSSTVLQETNESQHTASDEREVGKTS